MAKAENKLVEVELVTEALFEKKLVAVALEDVEFVEIDDEASVVEE